MLKQLCVVLLCDSACVQTSVYFVCHAHPKRDAVPELVGVGEPSARVFTCQVKAEEVTGGCRVCWLSKKGHWLFQPLTDSSNGAG